MEENTKTKINVGNIFLSLVPMGVFLVVNYVVSFVAMFIIGYKAAVSGTVDLGNLDLTALMSQYSDITLIATIIFQVIVGALAIVIYRAVYKEFIYKQCFTHFTWKSPVAIIFMAAGVELLLETVLTLIADYFPEMMEYYSGLMETSGLADLSLLSAVATLIIAPITEEAVFRGFTLRLAKGINGKFWLANIVQALLFGIVHGNLVQGAYAFLLGLVLGYIYEKYQSLVASTLCHMVFNFVGTFVIYWITESTNLNQIEITGIALVALAVGIVSCRFDNK